MLNINVRNEDEVPISVLANNLNFLTPIAILKNSILIISNLRYVAYVLANCEFHLDRQIA